LNEGSAISGQIISCKSVIRSTKTSKKSYTVLKLYVIFMNI